MTASKMKRRERKEIVGGREGVPVERSVTSQSPDYYQNSKPRTIIPIIHNNNNNRQCTHR